MILLCLCICFINMIGLYYIYKCYTKPKRTKFFLVADVAQQIVQQADGTKHPTKYAKETINILCIKRITRYDKDHSMLYLEYVYGKVNTVIIKEQYTTLTEELKDFCIKKGEDNE